MRELGAGRSLSYGGRENGGKSADFGSRGPTEAVILLVSLSVRL